MERARLKDLDRYAAQVRNRLAWCGGKCNAQNGLCAACSVFGTILGDDLSFQGKVRFADAIGKKDDLEKGEFEGTIAHVPEPNSEAPKRTRSV
jgi:hypothetical protein